MLENRSSIPGVGKNNVLVTKSNWPTLVSSVSYATIVSASADRDFKLGSKYWATIQPDPSREIYITKAHNTIPFIAAHTLSGMNKLRISPGFGVL